MENLLSESGDMVRTAMMTQYGSVCSSKAASEVRRAQSTEAESL